MTDAQIDITDAPGKTRPARQATTTEPPTRPKKQAAIRRRPYDPEDTIELIRTEAFHCHDKVMEWKLRIAKNYAWGRRNLARKEWHGLFTEKRLPIGIRSAQMQCRIGDNWALCGNVFNLHKLPQSIAALSILATLKPDSISRLCEDDVIHPKLTTAQAKALVRTALAAEAAGTIEPPFIKMPRERQ